MAQHSEAVTAARGLERGLGPYVGLEKLGHTKERGAANGRDIPYLLQKRIRIALHGDA